MINKRYKADEWQIIEESFNPEQQEMAESVFSIGNGQMGQRANFEESYSGHTLQGTYIGGIYYPDKTRVGWWKNGYPEYFAKVLNAPSWIGIDIYVDSEKLDLATCKLKRFRRTLDMKKGLLERSFSVTMQNGKNIEVDTVRFVSMVRQEAGAIKYTIKTDSRCEIQIVSYVNSDVRNADANYDEKFWNTTFTEINELSGVIVAETKKTAFTVATGFTTIVEKNDKTVTFNPACEHKDEQVSQIFAISANDGDEIIIYKYVSVNTTLQYSVDELLKKCKSNLSIFRILGFKQLLQEHID